jgi:diguanylate cyclase (GGDEF)-like protein
VRWKFAWPIYLGTLAILATAYAAAPTARPVLIEGTAALGAAVMVFGVWRWRPERWRAWLLIAAGLLLAGQGRTILALMGSIPYVQMSPHPRDILSLVSYLPLTVGLLWLGRARLPSRDWFIVLDIAALTIAASFLMWIILVRPVVEALHPTQAGEWTFIASWVGHVALLAAAARVAVAWRNNLALALVSTGVAMLLVGDLVYGLALVRGVWRPDAPVDTTYLGGGLIAFAGLAGLAALTPSMARVASPRYARHQLGPVRLAGLALGLLVGPTALLVEATQGMVADIVAIAAVSVAVGALVLVRLSLSAMAYRRRVGREHAALAASRALVVATTNSDVTDVLDTALTAVVPADSGWPPVRIMEVPGAMTGGATLAPRSDPDHRTAANGRAIGELEIRLRPRSFVDPARPARVVTYAAALDDLVEVAPFLQALTEQAGAALDRIDLVGKLQAAEREHYFRTLVLTSTDVTLISRHGRIEYATPSAYAMFGRDVRDACLTQVVTREPGGTADASEPWSDVESGVECYVHRPDGTDVTVRMHCRDLTADPSVNGVVTTLRDVTAEREAQRNLAYRASHDLLTGLCNGDVFRSDLRAGSTTAGSLSAVLFIDLDDFKTVNDTFGHEVGDGLLIDVARRIREVLRSHDVAARLGGDEFGILLRDLPDAATAGIMAQRISDSLSTPATVEGIVLDSQTSIGLALARTAPEYASVLRQADAALYAAKAEGKGHWRLYQDGMLNPARRRIDQRTALESLMRGGALSLHYQPIVELATGLTTGFEALIGCTRSTHEAGLPDSIEDLLRVADDTGLTVQLGDWVLGRAIADAARLNPPETPGPRYVSVNVSIRQLRDRGFVDRVRDLLVREGVAPTLLAIEIAENHLVAEDECCWGYLADLRGDGVHVAIDDYGTGYNSLSHLRQPAIDIVKLDRGLLRDIDSYRTQTLLEGVIGTVTKLGLDAVAEGVKDRHTRDTLLALGCRYGQGILYAPSLPIEHALTTAHRPQP